MLEGDKFDLEHVQKVKAQEVNSPRFTNKFCHAPKKKKNKKKEYEKKKKTKIECFFLTFLSSQKKNQKQNIRYFIYKSIINHNFTLQLCPWYLITWFHF